MEFYPTLISWLRFISPEEVLVLASEYGYLWLVQALVKRGARIDFKRNKALKWACDQNQIEVVRFLLDQGADPEDRDGIAIQLAIDNNYLELFHLLEPRVNINDPGIFFRAFERDYLELAQISIGLNEGEINRQYLWIICGNGCLKILKVFLDSGKFTPEDIQNGLEFAVLGGHVKACELLIERGGDVKKLNIQPRKRLTPEMKCFLSDC